ncbi:MAG: iron ABC transporter permease [Desulfosporosinus sp.]|nr:iron ABC transporter permease [Desulfosporosinus sp.]
MGIVIAFVICLSLGKYHIPVWQVAKIILSKALPLNLEVTWTEQMASIILDIRLPRLIGAFLVGGALSLSGATYQGLFKNPLVSPDLLGVSSGACVGASIAILLNRTSLEIQLAALVMGLLAVFLTTTIPKFFKNNSNLMLVLAGIIVSGFMTAIQGIIKYVADPESQLASIVYWTMGSLASLKMRDILLVGPVMLIVALILILIRWRINLLSLGDSEAKSLGVNVPRSRGLAIVCATILTACSVCLCGTIGWVGLIMPHLGRLLVGEDNRYLMPASALLGALFMIIVDTVARNLTGSEVPLSIVTGLLGAPLFLWLLARQKARIN